MRILIADDHPLTLVGTKTFLEQLGYTIDYVCSNGLTALNLMQAHAVNLAILDVNMPGMNGLEVLKELRKSKLRTKVVLVTMHRERSVYKTAQEYDVDGYILKEHAQDELARCISDVLRGEKYISPSLEEQLLISPCDNATNDMNKLSVAEKRILELVAQQHTSREIAAKLFISEKTVEGHRRNIIEKLQLPKEKNALLLWTAKNMSK